jgi:hypothetical protein
MFGWFKKKPVVPPITDALYAIKVGCGAVMQCQVSFALGKDGSAPIGDGLGMGASALVGFYAYGFVDGATQSSGALQAWANGDEYLMLHCMKALVQQSLEGACLWKGLRRQSFAHHRGRVYRHAVEIPQAY